MEPHGWLRHITEMSLQVMENNPKLLNSFSHVEGTSLWMDNIVMLKSSKIKNLPINSLIFL